MQFTASREISFQEDTGSSLAWFSVERFHILYYNMLIYRQNYKQYYGTPFKNIASLRRRFPFFIKLHYLFLEIMYKWCIILTHSVETWNYAYVM